MLYIDDGQQMK